MADTQPTHPTYTTPKEIPPMSPHDSPAATWGSLTPLLGPRQADVMRLLWARGPATVRQLLSWLTADRPLAYQTIMTVCARLTERGLLERRLAANADESARYGQAYVYAPRISEDAFLRLAAGQESVAFLGDDAAFVQEQRAGSIARPEGTARSDRAQVEQLLAYLEAMRDEDDQRSDEIVLQTLAALLERAENAERAAATWEAKAHHAELQVQAAERCAKAAERRAEKAGRALRTLQQQLSRPPRPRPTPRRPRESIVEHCDPAGICRVCGAPAPRPYKSRKDGLRVCMAEACRTEARRRDNLAKQHRSIARRSAAVRPT